jgi:Flp pilus assembly protein TadD
MLNRTLPAAGDRPPATSPRRGHAPRLAAVLATVLALAGCADARRPPPPAASVTVPMTGQDYEKAVAYWGPRYDANPRDRTAELNYAAALRRLDRLDQASAVLQKSVIYHPDDREVLAAYGKALAAGGDFQTALALIQRAQTPDRPDWRLLSAEAAIRDETGDHDEARRLYRQALALAPNEPSILSNLGMSYVLTGDLKQAETVLRQAVALPNADSRVRQNLALAVALSGRLPEAEKIAAADQAPDQAAANVAYLKSMLAEPTAWRKLKSTDTGDAGPLTPPLGSPARS